VTQTQLRIYDIEPGRLDDFLAAWSAGVVPLRARFGFGLRGWVVPDDDRFVWLVTYGGPGGFEAADDAYYASPEREALDPDPAQWVIAQTTMWLEPIELPATSPAAGA
jgi:hypothetical protein